MNIKIETTDAPEKYTGLYVVDFGDYSSIGFTGEQVEALLESEKDSDMKIYKIYNAYPDGTFELRGMPKEVFNLESGLFFYGKSLEQSRQDYRRLLELVQGAESFPVRARLELSRIEEDCCLMALIYPAEADGDVSRWLLEKDYTTSGAAEGGIGKVEKYYASKPQVIESEQILSGKQTRETEKLFSSVKYAAQA